MATTLTAAGQILDFSQPVALMLMGVLGHVADVEEAQSIVKRLMDPLPSGSYLALNDGANLTVSARSQVEAQQDYGESGAVPYYSREPEEIISLFDGLELVDPGVVSITRWRPRSGEGQVEIDGMAGIGRKP